MYCRVTPMWNAMVTLALSPSDPRSRSERAKAAVEKELDNLRAQPTWDEQHPIEMDEAKERFPDAHYASIFPLTGIKNYEDADEAKHIFKGRIVLGGHNIKNSVGDYALFQDVGSTPSTMTAARIALAMAALFGLDAEQTDCIHAYVQANLEGPPTFITLPREWWPAS